MIKTFLQELRGIF